MQITDPGFWIALLQIIGVNIVLSGDNAVVIALAARSLPPAQQRQAVLWGSGAAVVMRIVLTVVAVQLLVLPYLKLVGAALLLWIGVQLLIPEEEKSGPENAVGHTGMMTAIRTILLADLVMSLDNVIAVAAAAKGSMLLLVIGLLVSIPLVIFGSTLLMKVMERHPIIVTVGGGLLGWVAGEMAIGDPLFKAWIDENAAWLHYAAPLAGLLLVIAIGKFLAKRADEERERHPAIDLASPADQHGAPLPRAAEAAKGILLVADESPAAQLGVDRFVEQMREPRGSVRVELLNVQSPVHRDVSTFIDEASVSSFHHDEGMKALEPSRAKLEKAGIACVVHIGVGDFGHVVAHYANELPVKEIYITETAHGHSADVQRIVEQRTSSGTPVLLRW